MVRFSDLKIRTKLALLMALPLLGLLYLSVGQVADKYRLLSEDRGLQQLATLAISVSDFLNEVQKERGSTNLFIGSRGTRFGDELRAQRALTDTQLAAVQATMGTLDKATLGDELSKSLERALAPFQELPTRRAAADSLGVPAGELFDYYTATVDGFMVVLSEVPPRSTNAEITRTAAAYTNLLQAKEQMAKERGLMSGVFNRFSAFIAAQDTYTRVFQTLATDGQRVRMQGSYQGDFATIKDALNTAVQNLDDGLGQVAAGSGQVATAASQIGNGSQALAQGASEQAATLEEIASSLHELTAATDRNSANTTQARSLTEEASHSAAGGVASMGRLSTAVDQINASSSETAKIVKTIDEIAFQTNLLALNAAVEASRVGDAGRGFAVVAEEVRALAQRSATAAKTTADLIEQSVGHARGGVALNGEVSRHLAAINDQINRVGQVLGDVATASERQSRGIGQINGAITQLGQLTQGNAANAEESAAAAVELSGQSAQMQALVGAYQLTDDYDARDVDARPALDTPAAPQHGPRRRPSGDPATRHASASLVGATAAPALLR